MINDKWLLEGLNSKKERAWGKLYESYFPALCNYVNRYINDPESSEDVVQEVLVSIWKNEKVFTTMEELTKYIYKSCYNNALVFIRNNNIHCSILNSLAEKDEDFTDDFYEQTIREEVSRQLYNHIESLSPEQKKVILLRIDGFTWDEIAEKLSVSPNTIKTHKARAFNTLREKLKDSVILFLL